MTDDASAAPSTRHGDVLLTVWIIVGATMVIVLTVSETLSWSRWMLPLIGAVSAGYGETLSRRLRPHVRFADTAAGVVLAFLLLPHVARFGSGAAFDAEAIVTMALGIPLGLGAAWSTRRADAGAGGYPELAAGVCLIAASVALGVIGLVALAPRSPADVARILEVAFLLASIAAGVSFAALVPTARPGHLILGALVVLVAPRMMLIGILQHLPAYDVFRWAGALGVGGTLGCLVGRWLRVHAAARVQPATNLPPARVHDGDAGESHDPR